LRRLRRLWRILLGRIILALGRLLRILGRGRLLLVVPVGRGLLTVRLLLHHHLLLLHHHLLLLLDELNIRIGCDEPIDEHAESDYHQWDTNYAKDDHPCQNNANDPHYHAADYIPAAHPVTTDMVYPLLILSDTREVLPLSITNYLMTI
jgi:hypothetical protein